MCIRDSTKEPEPEPAQEEQESEEEPESDLGTLNYYFKIYSVIKNTINLYFLNFCHKNIS